MFITKIDNLTGSIKIVISILLSIACIYQVGIISHFNYFFLILFLSFFKKNQLEKYLNGTFSADLVLSILFLSFSWNDYAALSSFRSRAHILSPIFPAISLYVSLIYFYEFKRNDFKLNNFSEGQTSFPIVAILLGLVSGISTEINHGVDIFSSFHFFIIILFIFANFITIRIFFKKEFNLIKLLPLSLFITVILICKSKIYILLSFISIFLSFEKIFFKTLLNQEILSIFNKLLYFLKIILISLVLTIFVGGINLNYIGIIAKPLDLLLTYRLSINSSLFYALDYVDVEKVNPRLFPNREFQLSEKLKRLINNKELKNKRIEHLSDLYDTETINNKILTKNFHNSLMYYSFIHKTKWNLFLYVFLIFLSGICIIRNQSIDNMLYFLYLASGLLNYIPYLSFIIILSAIFICLELTNILKTSFSKKII